jgi:hypothetical protein
MGCGLILAKVNLWILASSPAILRFLSTTFYVSALNVLVFLWGFVLWIPCWFYFFWWQESFPIYWQRIQSGSMNWILSEHITIGSMSLEVIVSSSKVKPLYQVSCCLLRSELNWNSVLLDLASLVFSSNRSEAMHWLFICHYSWYLMSILVIDLQIIVLFWIQRY